MKQRIAHVCAAKGLGGLELYSLQLHQKFSQIGHEGLHFVLEDSPLDVRLKDTGLPVVRMRPAGYLSLTRILHFRRSIKAHDIRRVIVHHLKDLWFVTPALIGLKNVEVVGVSHMFLRNVTKKDVLHKFLYKRLKKIISLTKVQKEGILKCLPVKEKQIEVIPNGIDLERFKFFCAGERKKLRHSIEISDRDILIGVVGRIEPAKGQKELIEAFSRLKGKHKNIKLCLIGEYCRQHKGFRQELEQLILKNEIQNDVKFLGYKSNVNEWMHAFDLFVMPSHEETFGMVLIEAMAAGVPCISTRSGGVPEIISSTHLGTLVPPKSIDGLEHAMATLISCPQSRKRIGAAGREYVHEKYDLNKIISKIGALYTPHSIGSKNQKNNSLSQAC